MWVSGKSESGGEMAKPSNGTNNTDTAISKDTIISGDVDSKTGTAINLFFKRVGVGEIIPPSSESKDFYTYLIGALLKVDRLERGRVSCLFSVEPVITNFFGGLHGGAVAALAEMMSIACAKTVVGEDKEIFLGELSMSYLSAAPRNAELTVDASVIRSGRNLTVIAVEFRYKESGRLAYTSRATFYNMPLASL